jgi:hypothetical protein
LQPSEGYSWDRSATITRKIDQLGNISVADKMSEAEELKHDGLTMPDVPRTPSRTIYIVAAAIAVVTTAVHTGSYWFSPSLTLLDVSVTLDEGLFNLGLPLVRLTSSGSSYNEAMIYTRGPNRWEIGSDGDGKSTLRQCIKYVPRRGGKTFLDFGYRIGDWRSSSRPGPWIDLFMPVPALGAIAFGMYLFARSRFCRFGIRTMFAIVTICAAMIWLLTLRAT